MARLATFHWRSRSPTDVDESLVVYDDAVLLVVRRPRRPRGEVGTYVADAGDDRATLLAAGPGPVVFDAWHPPTDPGLRALHAAAERVAGTALGSPLAVVAFQATLSGASGANGLDLALVATASGTRAVVVQLDPGASSVRPEVAGDPRDAIDLPRPVAGFVTAEASGMGGLASAARLPPGTPVAVTCRVALPDSATAITVDVAGTLGETLPDEPDDVPFVVRTPSAPVPR